MKHICEAITSSRFSYCGVHGVTAKYEHLGKWYCKTHHPPTFKAKEAERDRQWKADWDREKAARANAAAIRKAEQRVLAIACGMQIENERGGYSLNVLFDAVTDLRVLGWELKS